MAMNLCCLSFTLSQNSNFLTPSINFAYHFLAKFKLPAFHKTPRFILGKEKKGSDSTSLLAPQLSSLSLSLSICLSVSLSVCLSVVRNLGSKNALILETTGYWLSIAKNLNPT
ncbi:hypothetical protein RchiOBHm_Chr7g0214491 [Rosa chinensis]|uniref:Uncharacterized protein n=1 Tax=Rosa chinensis TaxID=74649 RepID=A0A2P6PB80_ROSCH|nr:hypothetical protein RchiOBHm_Chr7g0214491 [Rosa chinensis]